MEEKTTSQKYKVCVSAEHTRRDCLATNSVIVAIRGWCGCILEKEASL